MKRELGVGTRSARPQARTAEGFDDAALSAGDDATRREKLPPSFATPRRPIVRPPKTGLMPSGEAGTIGTHPLFRCSANAGMMQDLAQAYTNARSEGR